MTGYITLIVEYKGHDEKKDRRIIDAAKRQTDGCGFLFPTNTRDISFSFKREDAANRALKRIKALKISGLKAHTC